VIGVTCYVEPASWAVWESVPAALLPQTYVNHLRAAGARVVLLPPDDVDAEVLDRLDGLVLAGGADVGPQHYGEAPHPRSVPRPDRDAGELLLLRGALDRHLPVLGVCRGMQLLVVAYGGTLHQHMPELAGHPDHQVAPGVYSDREVSVSPGSRLAAILGGIVTVSCYHHQSVAQPGGLTVTAYAGDGVVEGVEDPDRRFVLGVQWHPEVGQDPRLFQALTAAARCAVAG
jgi:putative glutamine amidotransferase